ncbi:MAG: hypothetical protein RMM17_11330 [Acidobacteriota bacterium]|nr:hypothetical protein [Blastocatellia bacterium]MDW8413263.1 hypothetical protein [Acidobacteriota bacterium]
MRLLILATCLVLQVGSICIAQKNERASPSREEKQKPKEDMRPQEDVRQREEKKPSVIIKKEKDKQRPD